MTMLSKRLCGVISCFKSSKLHLKLFSILASTNFKVQPDQECTKWTYKLKISCPEEVSNIPTYRVMDKLGKVIHKAEEPELDNDFLLSMYTCMTQLNVMDKILYESQRQGRISFYMTNTGEEACQVGSAAGLNSTDLIYSQYRETGALIWRNYPVSGIINQCYGNCHDTGKGKSMPVHYGSREHNFVSISSPLTTQMPQAVGSAYAFKRAKNDRCVAVYFGEGAASEGDCHAAFNFAATLDVPVIFICRNNGYAISTPSWEQYRGDGIAGRCLGYGIPVLRVDGNDVLAVYNSVQAARKLTLSSNRPVLIEAMTYRVGHHSTSDDSSAYRSLDELQQWQEFNPIARFKNYLEAKKIWDDNKEKDWLAEAKNKVLEALNHAESLKKPDWREMFTDVNWAMPNNLVKQREYLSNHLNQYKEHYPLNNYENC